MFKKHKWIKIILCVIVLGIVYVGSSIYMSMNMLMTTTYEYESDKIDQPVNMVVLTDIHNHVFGHDSDKLVKKVQSENPDVIFLVGDVLNFYAEDDSFLIHMIKELKDIAPVYYTIGNHEEYIATYNHNDIEEEVEKAGAIYLDQHYVDIEVNNQQMRIGGLYDYSYNHLQLSDEQYEEKSSYLFLKEFEDSDAFKVVLSHRPESFITNDDDDAKWDIDLVLSGHEHGGQIRIPFFGGFYSTHLGLFSEYLDGYHVINGVPIIISRGLSTHLNKVPPRFNNIPEIVKISLS